MNKQMNGVIIFISKVILTWPLIDFLTWNADSLLKSLKEYIKLTDCIIQNSISLLDLGGGLFILFMQKYNIFKNRCLSVLCCTWLDQILSVQYYLSIYQLNFETFWIKDLSWIEQYIFFFFWPRLWLVGS